MGCVLFQNDDKVKLDIISYTSRVFTNIEQKLCTTYREIIKSVASLTIHEQVITGSDHSIKVLNDRKPILSCFTWKENLLHYFTLHKCKYPSFENTKIFSANSICNTD